METEVQRPSTLSKDQNCFPGLSGPLKVMEKSCNLTDVPGDVCTQLREDKLL